MGSVVREDSPYSDLDRLLPIFDRLQRSETIPTLQRLLKHPSTTYAERAAQILRKMGQDVPSIEPALPVRFHVFLNGGPWGLRQFSFEVEGAFGVMGSYHQVQSDSDGFINIPHDEVVGPAHEKLRLTLRRDYTPTMDANSHAINDPATEGVVATRPVFIGPPGEELVRVLVVAKASAPVPADLSQITDIHFNTCPLPIEIEYPGPMTTSRRAKMELRPLKKDEPNPNGLEWIPDYTMEFGDSDSTLPTRMLFKAVAPGTYQFSISAAGASNFFSPPFEAKEEMGPVRMKLEKGHDVLALVTVPEFGRGARDIRLVRTSDNVDVTHKYEPTFDGKLDRLIFAGMPSGHYQFRVLSTVEFMHRRGIKEWQLPSVAWRADPTKGVDCEGVSVDFAIDDNSPPLIDLGQLENKPSAAMKGKAAGRPARLDTGTANFDDSSDR